MSVYNNQAELDRIEDQLESLEFKYNRERRVLERKQERLQSELSIIQPTDLIEWTSKSGRVMRGIVKRVDPSWRNNFEYRCIIISKQGKEVGNANVSLDHHPTLIKKGKRRA